MQLTGLRCIPATNAEQESHGGERGAALLQGLDNRPWQQRGQDRHAGWRTEPEWALLEGFFASPSLNESNPYE